MIEKLLFSALEKLEHGRLVITAPDGKNYTFGNTAMPMATMRIKDWSFLRRVMTRGDIGFGETYIEGLWDTDDLDALLVIFAKNLQHLQRFAEANWWQRIGLQVLNRLMRRNSPRQARKNIQAHYDVGNDFYELWLDKTMTYSSAIYHGNSLGLEAAQKQKYQRILDKLSGENILEIGCGWGGFAEQAVSNDHHVTCLTISPAQHSYASHRLDGKNAHIKLCDYRHQKGLFDGVTSIEMFEAVGEQYWKDYFKVLKNRLKKGGNAVIQTITILDDEFERYRKSSDFIRHYTFPGGMLPSISQFKEEAKKAGLYAQEVFEFGQDYARTLRAWLKNFEGSREKIISMGYSDAFIRNWRFYLCFCAAGFHAGHTNVAQVVLTHD